MKDQTRRQIEEVVDDTRQQLLGHVRDQGRIAVVKAPPGSGKTHLLMQCVQAAKKKRVAIATQTRSQADDICRRLTQDFKLAPIRFAAASTAHCNVPYQVVTEKKDLPHDACIVVATSAKWGMLQGIQEFDILFV